MDIDTLDMEVAVMEHFGVRQNLIVPNVWWGMGLNHECDMLVLTKSNCAYAEVQNEGIISGIYNNGNSSYVL